MSVDYRLAEDEEDYSYEAMVVSSLAASSFDKGIKSEHRIIMSEQPSDNWVPFREGEVYKEENGEPVIGVWLKREVGGYAFYNEEGTEGYISKISKGDEFIMVKDITSSLDSSYCARCKGWREHVMKKVQAGKRLVLNESGTAYSREDFLQDKEMYYKDLKCFDYEYMIHLEDKILVNDLDRVPMNYLQQEWRYFSLQADRVMRINDIRVERLQDISLESLCKEGIAPVFPKSDKNNYHSSFTNGVNEFDDPFSAWIDHWDRHAKEGEKWADNKWVYVFTISDAEYI